jgi:hypothetical protein
VWGILPTSSLPYTLPFYVWDKSFTCNSYGNCRGAPSFFPFWNPVFDKHAVNCVRAAGYLLYRTAARRHQPCGSKMFF